MRVLVALALVAACRGGDGEPCLDDGDCDGRCVGRRCEASECSCGPEGCDAPSPDCPEGWICLSRSTFLLGTSRTCLQACPCEEPFMCAGLYCTYSGPRVAVEVADDVPRGQRVSLRAAVTGVAPITQATWDLGEGTHWEGEIIEHAWPQEGDYEVTVEITDEDGETAKTTTTIEVCIPDGATPCDPAKPLCCGDLLCDPTTRICH